MFHKSHKKIHLILKKHHLAGTKKARKIFSFKYPKLLILVLLIGLAYYLFSTPIASKCVEYFENMGYFGILISGALVPLGFTAPFGLGLISQMIPQNIFLASIIAGFGALLADLLIFNTIKLSFIDELKELEKTKAIKEIEKIVKKYKRVKITHYLMYLFAGVMILTPLPDEIGISMLAGLTTINQFKFAIISFLLHTLSIFLIFLIL